MKEAGRDEEMDAFRRVVRANLTRSKPCPNNCKAVIVDGVWYRSLFSAGTESDLSFVSLSQRMTESKGAPRFINGHLVMLEKWLRDNPDWLDSFQ